MSSLTPCIQEIVNTIPNNVYFDSHTIINELIRNPDYHIEYIKACSDNQNINNYHCQIANEIKNISGIECIGEKSCSHNIYGRITTCTLFKKN